MWTIHTVEYYSAIERNETPVLIIAWTSLNKPCFKKPVDSPHILYDSFILNVQKRQITDRKQIHDYLDSGVGVSVDCT